jgi:hypothetical protein
LLNSCRIGVSLSRQSDLIEPQPDADALLLTPRAGFVERVAHFSSVRPALLQSHTHQSVVVVVKISVVSSGDKQWPCTLVSISA